MDQKLANLMGRIQKLINLADDPAATPAEGALARQRAEELMRQYRITEEQLIATDQTVSVPVLHSLRLYGMSTRMGAGYLSVILTIADHAGVRLTTQHKDGYTWAHLVGYEGDVRMVEWIYANAALVFVSRVDPTVDDNLTLQENCYRLRASGMIRATVARLMFGDNTPSLRSRVQRLYEAECRKRGEEAVVNGSLNARDYRQAYADGFVWTMYQRLRDARDAADSTGGAIELHGRAERVEEAFYGHFPYLRPSTTPATTTTTPTKVKPLTKAQQKRVDRRFYSPSAVAGQAAGDSAANEVELQRVPRAQRLDS